MTHHSFESAASHLGRIDSADPGLSPPAPCVMPPGTLPPVVTDPNTPGCDLQTAGPLLHVVISTSLNCQVIIAGNSNIVGFGGRQYYTDGVDTSFESRLAECGTFLATGGGLYGPDIPRTRRGWTGRSRL